MVGGEAAELPIVDVSAIQSHLQEGDPDIQILCDQIKEACQQWGAFRVVNHGVEEQLVQNMDSASRDLFNLPSEVKERAISPHVFDGYSTVTAISLGESMSFPAILTSHSLQQHANKLWPQGNPKFCDTLGTYSSKLADLAYSIIKLVLQGLGLHKHFRSEFEKCEAKFVLNYFSPCTQKSSDGIYFKAHKDFGVMAILYNDQVGGLEMRSKQGQWVTVKPLAASFLVIIGEALQIWSNDRCWSCEHRVVYGGRKPRISSVLFLNFPQEKKVCVPEDLIDDEHPQRYKSFVFKEYSEAKIRGTPLNILI